MNEICEIEDKSVTISFVRDVISADGICIGKRGERRTFLPLFVESCMHPGEYRVYPAQTPGGKPGKRRIPVYHGI